MGNSVSLAIQTHTVDAHTAVVALTGEMDVYTTPQAKDVMLDLVQKGYYHLIVNLQRTDYMDSTAIGMLVGTLKRVREQGGDLRLVAPSSRIRRLLEITRLVNVFPVFDSEQQAADNQLSEGAE